MANEYRLIDDVKSAYLDKKEKKPIVYGRKHEKVIEIADHNDVLIVEGKNKVRFTVRKENLIPIIK